MYHPLLENKSKEEIFENTYFYNLYLASKESAQLSTEECIKCIKKHHVLTNLIIFHLNEKVTFTKELCDNIIEDYKNVKNLVYHFSFDNIEILINHLIRNKEKFTKISDENFYTFIEQLIYARLNYSITFDTLIKRVIGLIKIYNVSNFSDELFINAWNKWESPVVFEKNKKNMISYMHAICGVEYKFTKDGNAILAYKGVKKDYTSSLTDRVTYIPGNIYECVCDYDLNVENSFGLSAWTYVGAHTYCSDHVMLVRIDINDIKYINFLNGKIRCNKFMVIKEVYEEANN